MIARLLLWAHLLAIVVWLGLDLAVLQLSLSLADRRVPADVRLDRAHWAERFDKFVLISYLITFPIGFALVFVRGHDPFASNYLGAKIALMGVITLVATKVLTGATGTTNLLKQIAAGAPDSDELETTLGRRVRRMAIPILIIYACIILMIFIAVSSPARTPLS